MEEERKKKKRRLFGLEKCGDTRKGKREKERRVWVGAILDHRFVNSVIGQFANYGRNGVYTP